MQQQQQQQQQQQAPLGPCPRRPLDRCGKALEALEVRARKAPASLGELLPLLAPILACSYLGWKG